MGKKKNKASHLKISH